MTAGTRTHRIILTGASGMLGQAVMKQLAKRSDVTVLALYRQDPPETEAQNIETVLADLTNSRVMTTLLKNAEPSVFIHTAATGMQLPRPSPEALREINTELPVRLAEMVARGSDCSFVQVSSGLAYQDEGRPLREEDPLKTRHPYGASKAEAERKLFTSAFRLNTRLTVVRPFSFTGEGDFGTRLFPSLLRSAAQGAPFQMSPGNQVRDHSSVDDIATGVIAAALTQSGAPSPSIFNLGTGDTRTLRELVTSVIDQLGLKVHVEFGARPQAADEPTFMVPDTTLARAVLDWTPRENIACAVWRLAKQSFPSLEIEEPERTS